MTSVDTTARQGSVPSGRLAENVMHFARVLRDAGLPVGTDRVLLAYDALRAGGIESRADFYAVLSACFVSRGEHRTLFDQAFHIFWKDPDLLGKIMQLLMPQMKQKADAALPPENRRLADAMFKGTAPRPPEPTDSQRIEIDAALSWTDREQLRKADCRRGAMRRRYGATGSTCARCCGLQRGRAGTSRASPTAVAALVPSHWSRWWTSPAR
jgi:uncharacterized protein with von Willebrand factor type A (vWA) domain